MEACTCCFSFWKGEGKGGEGGGEQKTWLHTLHLEVRYSESRRPTCSCPRFHGVFVWSVGAQCGNKADGSMFPTRYNEPELVSCFMSLTTSNEPELRDVMFLTTCNEPGSWNCPERFLDIFGSFRVHNRLNAEKIAVVLLLILGVFHKDVGTLAGYFSNSTSSFGFIERSSHPPYEIVSHHTAH